MSNIIKVKDNNGNWLGIPALRGEDGITPHIGENGNWFIGEEDTGVKANIDLTPYAKAEDVNRAIEGINIPTKVSELTNDTGFITNTVNNLTNYYKKSETYTQAEVNNLINAITTLNIEVVASLPTSNISTTTIYLKGSKKEGTNSYEEYIYVNNAWELIGTTAIDLTLYATKTYVDDKIELYGTEYIKAYPGLYYDANTTDIDLIKELYASVQLQKADSTAQFSLGELLSYVLSGYQLDQYLDNARNYDEAIQNFLSDGFAAASYNVIPYTTSNGATYTNLEELLDVLYMDLRYVFTRHGFKKVDTMFSFSGFEFQVEDDLGRTDYVISTWEGDPFVVELYHRNGGALKNAVLTRDNEDQYIPTHDYNPATKKYVDDILLNTQAVKIIGNLIYDSNIGTITEELLTAQTISWPDGVSAETTMSDLLATILSNDELFKYGGDTLADFATEFKASSVYANNIATLNYTASNGTTYTSSNWRNFLTEIVKGLVGVISKRGVYSIYTASITALNARIGVTDGYNIITYAFPTSTSSNFIKGVTCSEHLLMQKTLLSRTNTTEYTPTTDYNPATKKYVDDSINSLTTPESIYTLPNINETQTIETLYGNYSLTTTGTKDRYIVKSSPVSQNVNATFITSDYIEVNENNEFSLENSSFNITINGLTKTIAFGSGEGIFSNEDDTGGDDMCMALQEKINQAFGANLIWIDYGSSRDDCEIYSIDCVKDVGRFPIVVTSNNNDNMRDMLELLHIKSGASNMLNTNLTIKDFMGRTVTEDFTITLEDYTRTFSNEITIADFFTKINQESDFTIRYDFAQDCITLSKDGAAITTVSATNSVFQALGIYDSIIAKQTNQTIHIVNMLKPDNAIINNIEIPHASFTLDYNIALLQLLLNNIKIDANTNTNSGANIRYYTLTVPTTGWTSLSTGGGFIELDLADITANDDPIITLVYTDDDARDAELDLEWCKISRIKTLDGKIKFYAYYELPTLEMPITIKCIG